MQKLLLLLFGILLGIQSFGQVPTTNLVGEYKFTNGRLDDAIGNNDLTQTGNALIFVDNRAGGPTKAASLNGDYLQRVNTSFPAQSTISVSYWLKTSTNDANKRVIIDQTERTTDVESSDKTGWYTYLQNGKIGVGGNFQWYHSNNTASGATGYVGYQHLLSTVSVNDNSWHHVAITMHTRWYNWLNVQFQRYERIIECTYVLYIDGVQRGTLAQQKNVGSAPSPAVRRFTNSSNMAITIGDIGTGTSTSTYGDVFDDFRYYSKLLNATEVGQLSSETACSGTSGTTAIAQDITIALDASGNASIVAADIDNGSNAVCNEPVTLSVDKSTFTCADLGNNVVTLTARETFGAQASSTATATVTVTYTPAVITQDITVQLDASGNATIVPNDVTSGSSSTSICGAPLSLSLDKTTFTCADLGVNAVTLSANDGNGNIGNSTANVTIADGTAPTVVSQNISVQLDANTGMAVVTPAMIDNGSNDNCSGSLVLSLSKNSFGCNEIGQNTITLYAQDDFGNIGSATAMVTVSMVIVDQTVSTTDQYFCPDGRSATITTGGSESGVNYYLRNSTNDAIVDGPISGTGSGLSFNTGSINQTTTFNVYREITPPTNGALDFDGSDDHVISDLDPAFDYRNGFTIEGWFNGPATGSVGYHTFFSVGTTAISDLEAYTQQGTNYLTLVYNRGGTIGYNSYPAPPVNTWFHLAIVYSANVTTVYYNGVAQTIIQAGGLGAISKTANSKLVVGDDRNSALNAYQMNFLGKIDEVRLWNVAKTAAAINASKNNCLTGSENGLEAYFNYNDGSGIIATDLANGNNGTLTSMDSNTDWITGSSSIICGQVCGYEMSTEITVGDDIINPTALTQNVTLQLDASGNATVTASEINSSSSDNCTSAGSLLLSLDKMNFTCADLGANTVTLTVEDAQGNQNSTTATVTVQDTSVPTTIAQNVNIQLDAAGNASITALDINNGSTDNCTSAANLVLSLDKTAFSCADLGANVVMLTVEDASGNQANTNATVTVIDGMAPTAIAQNMTVQLDASGNATIATSAINNGSSDNCTSTGNLLLSIDKTTFSCADIGANAVTLTVEDASGNQSTATATITVEDSVAPEVFTRDITLNLDNNGNATLTAVQVNNGSSDNCTATGDLVMSLDITSFTATNLGANTVTLTVEDASGNSNTATATVTIEEKTVQTIIFGALSDVAYGESFILAATSDSGLPVSYEVISGPAIISGSNVTATGIGSVTIEATQAGDATFGIATAVQQSFMVNQASLTVTANSQTITFGEAISTLAYTYSGFVNGETASVLTSEPTISTTADANSNAGAYGVTLSGGIADNYIFTLVDGVLTINKADQIITVDAVSNKNIDDIPFDIVASTTSGLSLIYNVSGPATISGTTITLDGASGTVTVTVSQSGDVNYNAGSSTTTFNVIDNSKQNQTITVEAIADKFTNDAPFDVVASTTSGLGLTYDVTGSASISGTTITLDGTVGIVTVTVSQAGDVNFNAASSTTTFNVIEIIKQTQTITFAPIDNQILESGQMTLTATASSGLTVSYAILSGPATVNGDAVTFNALGTVVISASQSGDNNFLSATDVEQSFELITITSVSAEQAVLNSIIYPNPAGEKIIISGLSDEVENVTIVDMNGVLMSTHVPEAAQLTIDIQEFAQGVYIAAIKSKNGVQHIRFIKK